MKYTINDGILNMQTTKQIYFTSEYLDIKEE